LSREFLSLYPVRGFSILFAFWGEEVPFGSFPFRAFTALMSTNYPTAAFRLPRPEGRRSRRFFSKSCSTVCVRLAVTDWPLGLSKFHSRHAKYSPEFSSPLLSFRWAHLLLQLSNFQCSTYTYLPVEDITCFNDFYFIRTSLTFM